MKFPTLPLSNYLLIVVLFVNIFIGIQFLNSYSNAHWSGVGISGYILYSTEAVYEQEKLLISESEVLEKYFALTKDKSKIMNDIYKEEMGRNGLLRFACGLICLIIAILSIFCKSRWLVVMIIPFSLGGAFWLNIVM